MIGIALIDKPPGITSHDVVSQLRRRFGTRRVGHAGTLDPQATGLLVCAIGPATRFLQYLALEPKVYEGTIRFGIETTTQDSEGDVVATKPLPDDLEPRFEAARTHFVGFIEQVPPLYSAIKKEGKPLYVYARQGIEVERRPRRIHIQEFEALEWLNESDLRFRTVCSGGTYVRALANDVGAAVGCGAHLAALRRTQVGRFDLAQAVLLADVDSTHVLSLHDALVPPSEFVALSEAQVGDVRLGRSVSIEGEYGSEAIVMLNGGGTVVGMARYRCNQLHPECVIPAELA